MSAGHRHPHTESQHRALVAECLKLVQDPQIVRYMKQDWVADYKHEMPLTGGSSIDGRTYYVDPDVPQEYRKYVLWHERIEKVLRAVKSMSYDRSHRLATAAERAAVVADGKDWEAYKKAIGRIVRLDEGQGPQKLPRHFDLGPLRESGMMRLAR